MNNEDIVEKIKEEIDIVQLIGDYVYLKKSGANHVGLCPFHSEKTPSFTVSESKQIFHCFGCGEGGDGIKFVMLKENLDFIEAVKFLAEKYNIQWEGNTGEKEDTKKPLYEIMRAAALYYHENLTKHQFVIDYLKSRNISYDFAKKFGLGFAEDSWDKLQNHLLKKGYSHEDMLKVGLIGRGKNEDKFYDKFRNRLIFPIIDTRSRVIAFGGRVFDDSLPKYLNSQDSLIFNKGYHLYALNLVSKNSDRKRIILVEGYMDVISLYSKGINCAVASLGTALTQNQAKLLKRYGEEVYICYDGDAAGIKATLRAIDVMLKMGIEPKIVVMPPGVDPDDFINKNGLAAFEKKVNNSLNHIDFKVYILKENYDLEDADGKYKFTLEVAKILKNLTSPVQTEIYIDKIANEVGISKEALDREVKGAKGRSFNKQEIKPVTTKLPPAHRIAESNLIALMVQDKDYFHHISERISPEEFNRFECKELYNLITTEYEMKDIIDKKDLLMNLDHIDNDKIIFYDEIINQIPEYQASNIEKVIDDLIKNIKLNNLLKERREALDEMEAMEKSGINQERFLELANLITMLNKKINLLS